MADERTDTFLREVDEELRREQLQKLWDRYGLFAIGLAALIVFGVGAYKYWQGRQIELTETTGARFESAAKLATEGKADEALQAYTVIAKDSPRGYQALSRFQIANSHAKAGRIAEALPLFETLGQDATLDAGLRDFARLQAAMLRLDSADWTEMENRLTPVLTEASPWRALARETLGLAAYKAGKFDEAKKLFEQTLGDRTAPPSLAERAYLLMALLTDAEAAKTATVIPIPANVPLKPVPGVPVVGKAPDKAAEPAKPEPAKVEAPQADATKAAPKAEPPAAQKKVDVPPAQKK